MPALSLQEAAMCLGKGPSTRCAGHCDSFTDNSLRTLAPPARPAGILPVHQSSVQIVIILSRCG
jgi:hypothetical protein